MAKAKKKGAPKKPKAETPRHEALLDAQRLFERGNTEAARARATAGLELAAEPADEDLKTEAALRHLVAITGFDPGMLKIAGAVFLVWLGAVISFVVLRLQG